MRIAANLKWMFTEAEALARPQLARNAGFDGVEVLSPFENTPDDWHKALDGLPMCLINTLGHGAALGNAAVPGEEAQFRADFAQALIYAQATGAGRLHVMAGKVSGAEADLTYRRNLEWAAGHGLALTIEPLNGQDMPGYFLNDYDQAAEVLADLGAPNIGLQFDLWHAHRIHGDINTVWARHADIITHVQIAGFPARAEPCLVAQDFARRITAAGYQGWIAGEYAPSGPGQFDWLTSVRNQTI
jgi:2-dehydrotetronate isomerase